MRIISILLLSAFFLFTTTSKAQPYSADLCNLGTSSASASSAWSGSYAASFAFDNYTTNTNCWASSAAPTVGSPQWLKYDFGSGNEKIILKYTVTARYYTSDQTRCPKDWTFEGSNDDSNWDILDTQTEQTGWNTNSSPTTKREYTFTNTTAYRYYRIVITANNGGTSYVAIGEMEMMSNLEYTNYNSKRSNVWYFGNYAGLNFNTEPVSVLTDGAMLSREGCSSICDTAGNLMFYTNGATVWNKDHDIMDNGTDLMVVLVPSNPPHPTQAGVIVPKPGNSNQYYIFTVPCMWTSPSYDMYFRYALVDMSYNGGLGKVIEKDVQLGSYNASERITAVAHQNGNDIWVINREDNTNRFRSYLITSSGIDTSNVVTNELGAVSSGNCNMGCLKASPDGKKLAMGYWCDGAGAHFELYDFNNSTGVISNLNDLGYPSGASRYTAYGIEFSPDGSLLYGSTHMNYKIYQWNLQAGDNTAIKNSITLIGTTSNYVGSLQLAPNGKIYCSLSIDGNTGYHTIGVIDNPNTLGTGCSYVNNGIRVDVDYTGANLSRQGFPNFIQSFLYASPFTYANTCFGDSTQFTMTSTSNVDSVLWNFGDLASGAENISELMNPAHVFSDTGDYQVQAIVYLNNATVDTLEQIVTINAIPDVNLGSDTTMCTSGNFTLDAGNAGATFLWNDASANQTIQVSSTGIYSVTVTNSYGCVNNDSISVDINQSVSVNLGNDTTLCDGESIVLDAENTGSTYLWSDGSSAQTLSVNAAGTYAVTVTNAGCEGNDSITISVNPLPDAAISPSGSISICDGNAQTLTVSGGDSYLWSTAETSTSIVVSPMADTYFYVTATNSCGSDVDSVQILVNGANATITASLDSVCQGQSVELTASGGVNYSWSTGETTQVITDTPLSSTTYSVTVSGNGCEDSTDIYVVVKPAITATVSPTEICSGETATLSVSGGSSYAWSTGESAQTISVSPASTTTYYITVTNSGCSDSTEVSVTVNALPDVNLGNDTSFCVGSALNLEAQNSGATYIWNDASTNQTLNVTLAGNYSVTVTDANGCESADTISVSVNSLPEINLGNDTSICQGASVILDAQNTGATYQWSDLTTNQTLLVSSAGTYSVTVTDVNSCQGSDEIVISMGTTPDVSLGNDTSLCEGGSIVLNAGGVGYTYAWSTASTNSSITVATAGDYSVTVTSSDDCTSSDTISIGINSLPIVSLGNDTSFCEGNSITLDAENTGATYAWSDNSTNQTMLVNTSGTYSVTVTTAENCSSSNSIVVSVYSNPIVDLGSNTSFCEGSSFTLDAENIGSSYIWSDASTSQNLDVTAAGTYSVTVTSAAGCQGSDDITLSLNAMPQVELGADKEICEGNTTTLVANSGYTYIWTGGSTADSLVVSTTGTYYVTVSNSCGSVTDFVAVTVSPLPQFHLGDDMTVYEDTTITIESGISDVSYLWSNGAVTENITVTLTADIAYNLLVTDTKGCSAKDTIYITVLDKPVVGLVIYNTFTPNEDGKNDSWYIENIEKYTGNHVWIYNRNGNLIFETEAYNNSSNNWDGKYNGNYVPASTYYYLLDLGDGSEIKKGYITIIK